jgi:hypothetical protein
MSQLMRFGRRVPLPSTLQILHDLLVAQRDDQALPGQAGQIAPPPEPASAAAPSLVIPKV